jgi:hypothetical protein
MNDESEFLRERVKRPANERMCDFLSESEFSELKHFQNEAMGEAQWG